MMENTTFFRLLSNSSRLLKQNTLKAQSCHYSTTTKEIVFTEELVLQNIINNVYFLPYVFDFHKDTCFYCASFNNPKDCKDCYPSKKLPPLSFEEQIIHIGLMSITQHYFHNKNKSYAEAKYLGQVDQARVLFDLYEKGSIKFFPGWFKTYNIVDLKDSIASRVQIQRILDSTSQTKELVENLQKELPCPYEKLAENLKKEEVVFHSQSDTRNKALRQYLKEKQKENSAEYDNLSNQEFLENSNKTK